MKLHTLTYPSVLPAINKNSQQPNLMTVFLAGICEADEIPSSIFKDLVSISRTHLKFRQGVIKHSNKGTNIIRVIDNCVKIKLWPEVQSFAGDFSTEAFNTPDNII
jgi:hypothetical protein